ncbi:sporulation protein [Clostridium sp.]|uniref:sporulation protein n=1 Tax=Clostridium sp. TaxID=1506 RepID=UPI002FCB25C6
MSFFKKTMANVLGIGGTKIDTIIDTNSVPNGGTVEGSIIIKGGKVEQKVSKVKLNLDTSYDKEGDESTYTVHTTLQSYELPINRLIQPGEVYREEFKFKITPNTPISIPKHRVYISTNLDIEGAIDSGDGDPLNVYANRYMQVIIDAVNELGFRIREVENIKGSYIYGNQPFVQEFEFVPTGGVFYRRLDELEVIFIHKQNGIDIFLQVDRKANGFGGLLSEKFSLDETNVKIYLSYDEILDKNRVKNILLSEIEKHTY